MCTLAQFAPAGWQLWRACDLAAESSRHKDEFMAMLAHELKSPLAAIISAHEMVRKISGDDACLLRTDLPQADLLQADLLQAVDVVGRQARHLSRMVDDLMDLSRIGRGELEVHKEPVELRTIVDQATEATHPQFERCQHRLSVRIPEDSIRINGDPGRLVQLLSNLLDNAAKFTPKGGEISIAAECADENICIRVHDNGIGIPRDRIETIFDRYTQLHGFGENHRKRPRPRIDAGTKSGGAARRSGRSSERGTWQGQSVYRPIAAPTEVFGEAPEESGQADEPSDSSGRG